jgi:hypothetical protein
MSFKYKEQASAGSVWLRCSSVNIDNRYGATPHAFFTESRVSEVGAAAVEQYSANLTAAFDPASLIPLRDPETGNLTGDTVAQGTLYQILYSLYMQTALARDAQTP